MCFPKLDIAEAKMIWSRSDSVDLSYLGYLYLFHVKVLLGT